MLQTIHDKLKGWLAGVVLGAIGLVFVFWGINWTMSAPNYAAKVNGVEISEQRGTPGLPAAARAVRAAGQRRRSTTRSAPQLKKRVLDEYVNTEALVTRADELGYRVSDQELLEDMAQVPAFQVNGKFDKAHARRGPARAGPLGRGDRGAVSARREAAPARYGPQQLELRDRRPSSARLRALTRQQRELTWLTLPAAKYAAEATPDDAAIKAYYDAHKSDYMTPETVNLRYVEVSLAELATHVSVDDAQLQAFFEEQKAKTPERYSQAEQRRVRHILLQVADPKDDAAVKAKAEAILKRAQGGEDFAKLAKEFSQDPGSAQQGGDLGWSERKVFVAPFADAAFSMKEGEIRGPVKTQFGYHILKLEGIQPASGQDLRAKQERSGDRLPPQRGRPSVQRRTGSARGRRAAEHHRYRRGGAQGRAHCA